MAQFQIANLPEAAKREIDVYEKQLQNETRRDIVLVAYEKAESRVGHPS